MKTNKKVFIAIPIVIALIVFIGLLIRKMLIHLMPVKENGFNLMLILEKILKL